ncbi:hypothetical protein GIB67_026824 [Kingdonia uniflora]|uniref:mRNA export factor GLE1 n=1 Tax=Kingdonia uniflora TaxID=39325 RepID=A0A7J7MI10_9MAGN|nr:hypothetical protein GIB67_026824 [Kingdonia uniflora]
MPPCGRWLRGKGATGGIRVEDDSFIKVGDIDSPMLIKIRVGVRFTSHILMFFHLRPTFSNAVTGSMVKAADIALKLEAERLRKHKELDEKNMALRLTSNKSFRSYELQIKTGFRKINGITDIVRLRASEFTQIINNPDCPQSIIIAMFANKAVYQCEQKILDTYFAIAHVVVLVTSKFPFAMDVLLAEFHKACIYTVPKHFIYSKTEINGVQNLHGLKEGWAWLARFLNALPANVYTATVLDAFLKMAGFTLFRKYKSQFLKILNVISRKYVVATEARRNPELNKVVMSIQLYIDERLFLQEPTGWRLETSLSSSQVAPQESQYYNQSNKWSNYS